MEIMSQLKHFFRGLREITSALTVVALPAATKQCCFGLVPSLSGKLFNVCSS